MIYLLIYFVVGILLSGAVLISYLKDEWAPPLSTFYLVVNFLGFAAFYPFLIFWFNIKEDDL